MPVPSGCTGSLLEWAKAVAGENVMPVPQSLNGRLLAWSNCSGAVRSRPVPFAPDVPTADTVTHSIPWPGPAMSSRIRSPTEMLVVDVTLRLVAPAGAAAERRGPVPGGRTAAGARTPV